MPEQGAGGLALSYFGPAVGVGAAQGGVLGSNPWLNQAEQAAGSSNSGDGTAGTPSSGAGGRGGGGEAARPVTAELLLTEYEEGTGAAKALGLTHTAGGATLYGDCQVEVYSNGSLMPSRRIEVPALASGQKVALCTAGAALWPECLPLLSNAPFNGNDALVLVCGERIVDSFGQVGFDPGSAWAADGVSSKDQFLVRCSVAPDRQPEDPFVIRDSWVRRLAGETNAEARARCVAPVSAVVPPHVESPPDAGASAAGTSDGASAAGTSGAIRR